MAAYALWYALPEVFLGKGIYDFISAMVIVSYGWQPVVVPKGRREYILVDVSPASLPDTPLWQGTGC